MKIKLEEEQTATASLAERRIIVIAHFRIMRPSSFGQLLATLWKRIIIHSSKQLLDFLGKKVFVHLHYVSSKECPENH